MTQSSSPTTSRFTLRTFGMLLIPVILLAGVITLFLSTGGGLRLESPAPIEDLNFERYHLERNMIELHIRNTGPEDVTIASVIINDAVMPFEVSPSPIIPRLGRAQIHINYAWIQGEAYGITIFTGNSHSLAYMSALFPSFLAYSGFPHCGSSVVAR
jgi:hypothetical protein